MRLRLVCRRFGFHPKPTWTFSRCGIVFYFLKVEVTIGIKKVLYRALHFSGHVLNHFRSEKEEICGQIIVPPQNCFNKFTTIPMLKQGRLKLEIKSSRYKTLCVSNCNLILKSYVQTCFKINMFFIIIPLIN